MQLVWIRFIQRFDIFEKIRYRHLHPQVVPNDSQYVEGASTKFEVMLNNCNQTIADNCSADLNSDGIFACAPIRLDTKMLFYPYYGAMGIQDYVDNYIFDGDYLLVGEDGAKWAISAHTL